MGYDVEFVNLGIKIKHLYNHFSIFGFDIAFYGIIIGIGMLLGLKAVTVIAKRTGQNPDVYVDFTIFAIIFSIIGARLYYVLFTWDYYKNNLAQIINIRGGGLAIYGGVISAFIVLVVFCKVRKQNIFIMADTAVIGLVIGQIIGRYGNFVNAEAFGGYTNNIFAMRLKESIVNSDMISKELMDNRIFIDGTSYIQVHPTFFYESCFNILLLIILLYSLKHKKFNGQLLYTYLGGYGIGRAVIEGLRTDSLMLPDSNIAVSQLFGFICFIIAIILIIYNIIKQKSAEK